MKGREKMRFQRSGHFFNLMGQAQQDKWRIRILESRGEDVSHPRNRKKQSETIRLETGSNLTCTRPISSAFIIEAHVKLKAIRGMKIECQSNEGDFEPITGAQLLETRYQGSFNLKTDDYYMDNHSDGHIDHEDGGLETRNFFVNCLCLLLGRLDSKRFERIVLGFGMNISSILVPQLNCTDEDVIVGVVSMFKAIIFKPNYSEEDTLTDSSQANIVILFLLHLLDERDGTSRAIAMLIAEYCSMSKTGKCFMGVLKPLVSANISQRRKAMDVIPEVIHRSSESQKLFPLSSWQDITNKLLERLGDEEIVIHEQASKLLPVIDPSLYLPALVGLVYSSDEEECIETIIARAEHAHARDGSGPAAVSSASEAAKDLGTGPLCLKQWDPGGLWQQLQDHSQGLHLEDKVNLEEGSVDRDLE